MARGKEFPLFVVMKAIDKATAPLRALGATASRVAKPFQKLRELNNRMRLAAEAGGLNKITGAVANLGHTMGNVIKKALKLGVAIGAIAMLGGGFLFKITKETSEYGDNVWKTSQKIGVGVKAWQEIAHAGEMSGIEQDALSSGLIKLNKNIIEAANGNKTMSIWFKRVGISVKDASGKVKSADQVLMEMAKIFGKMPDGPKKTAAAIALAGKSGANLIPMLNSGAKGLAEMRKEARDLGLVLDEDTARASEVFNDNISRLMKTIKGFVFYVGGLLIPVFDDIVVSIRSWITANNELIKSKLKQWVDDLKTSLPKLKKHFFAVMEIIKGFFIKISNGLELIGGFEGLLRGLGIYIGVSFVASIAAAANAFIALGVAIMTTPVGWIMAAIAVIAAGAILIYKNWEKVSGWLKIFGHILATPLRLFGELTTYLTSYDLFDIGAKIFTSLWDGMKAIAQGFMEKISSWWSAIKEFFSSISLFDIGAGIFSSLWDGMKAIFTKMKSWFGGLKSIIPDFLLPGNNVNINPPPGQGQGARITPAAGVIQKNQTISHKSDAAVKVEFANAPKGTTVKTEKNNGVDMDLNMGYAMATN